MSPFHKDTRTNQDTPVEESLPMQTKHNTSIHDSAINSLSQLDNSQTGNTQTNINNGGSRGSGLRILLGKSTPKASLGPPARDSAPRCRPGVRAEYVQKLTTWGRNVDSHPERITWLKGLAGVGRTAIAQTCVEDLGNKLAAAFFFSRPNNRDDPNRFFTSISHQLAVKYEPFGDIVDSNIIRNPALVDNALPHQFHSLIVNPIQQLTREGRGLPELVIVVDGLDECADARAQENIIKIIAQSAREQSTPFLWIILSCPEPHLVDIFGSLEVGSITLSIELHVSRGIDSDIAMFLTEKLKEMAQKHPQLPSPWPSEQEIWEIVDFSDGLLVCAEAASRFIDDDSSAGPEVQLRDVLRLAREHSAQKRNGNSSTGLDRFYTLVMEHVPPKQLQTVLWILLATRMPNIDDAIKNANMLGLSESQFRNACRSLHAVMTITNDTHPKLHFYHASFMEFLEDPLRSKRLFIWSDCVITLLADVLIPRFNKAQVKCDNDGYMAGLPPTWEGHSPESIYAVLIRTSLELLISVDLSDHRLKALNDFDFRKASFLGDWWVDMRPTLQESELIRRATIKNTFGSDKRGIWSKMSRRLVYVVGHGEKKALLVADGINVFWIQPYSKSSNQKLLKQMHEESPGVW